MSVAQARDWFFLDPEERRLLAAVLDLAARDGVPAETHAALEASIALLGQVAEAVRATPSIVAPWWNPKERRATSGEALIDVLCRTPEYDFELRVPTRAVVGAAYLVTKINFLKSLLYTTENLAGPAELRESLAAEVAQSIYSKMAEEIFVSIVTDPTHSRASKIGAGRFLFRIWEERLVIEIDDFAPVLEAAWEARHRVRPRLGTMLGTEEIFRMFQQARDVRFLDYFSEDVLPDEQAQAFEEFLFGLSHEEITQLRSLMTERGIHVVSVEGARHLLGLGPAHFEAENAGAQGQYSSYKLRQVKARYRALTGVPGPKKTAEEYMLSAFLAREPR